MNIAIIGGGPAGLRAAEVAAAGGANVVLYEGKASVGRKLLVAGRGGLNLTKVEPMDVFTTRYSGPDQPPGVWADLLAGFSPAALRAWATGLGVETFAAGTGRVYPRELKAAPLLRAWVRRLRGMGVTFAMHHRWTGLRPGRPHVLEFGELEVETDAVVLALGGGSWPGTGSDGGWVEILRGLGVEVAALESANCGWECEWPAPVLEAAEGLPLKNVAVRAGGRAVTGELLITSYGMEGGALYQLGPELRTMSEPALILDFKPDITAERLAAKPRTQWRLSAAAAAILDSRGPFATPAEMAATAKACVLKMTRPRPLAEAISSAGGVRWGELDAGLMLRRLPGVFAAGEMLDWEAPTGGYLLQGCFASGTRSGESALRWALDEQARALQGGGVDR